MDRIADRARKEPVIPRRPAPSVSAGSANSPKRRAAADASAIERLDAAPMPRRVVDAAPEPQPAEPAPEAPSARMRPQGSVYGDSPAPSGPRYADTKPFAGFEWNIARRYLRARRKEGFISVIAGFSFAGIAIGVAALIIVMAVMTGFREKLVNQIIGIDGHFTLTATNGKLVDYDAVTARVRAAEGVTRAAPVIEGQVMATSPRGASGALVRGLTRADYLSLDKVSQAPRNQGSLDRVTLQDGREAKFEGGDGVAVGARLALKLGLRVGDYIKLISPEGNLTPFGVTPRVKAYPITQVFDSGWVQYDSYYIYMPLDEAQIFFNKKACDEDLHPCVDLVEVMVKDPQDVDALRGPLLDAAGPGLRASDWRGNKGGVVAAIDVERKVMSIILSLIILVAALNIISGLVMLVKDKARDVAIMRTMGMSRGAVMRIFFICGSAIGVVGALAGFAVGVLFCLNIAWIEETLSGLFGRRLFNPEVYGFSEIPAQLVWSDVLFALGIALILSFVATIYPAWKAARLDPVEALRYE